MQESGVCADSPCYVASAANRTQFANENHWNPFFNTKDQEKSS